MKLFATKSIFILCIVFSQTAMVFAEDGCLSEEEKSVRFKIDTIPIKATFINTYGEVEEGLKYEATDPLLVYTIDDETIVNTQIIFYYEGNRSIGHKWMVWVYDSLGCQILSRQYMFDEDGLLSQIIYDGVVVSDIVQGETPCDIMVIEASGDTIFFHLDPENPPDIPIKNVLHYYASMMMHYPRYKDNFSKYDTIIFDRYLGCKRYHKMKEQEEKNKMENDIKE